MSCPQCGSDDWKLTSLVHKEGLLTSNSTSAGIGVSSRLSLGIGAASTSGTQQTELSKLAAPPASFVKTGTCVLGVFVTGLFGFFENWWWYYTALCAVGAVFFYRSETKQDDVATARYNKTKMCTRCGKFYVDT